MSQTNTPQAHRGQRQIKNMLIDRRIQLRLTFTSMLIILMMCSVLGFVLYYQNLRERTLFDKQRRKATMLYQKHLRDNIKLLRKIRGSATSDLEKVLQTATGMLDVQLKDKDPLVREMAQKAKSDLQKDDKVRLANQAKADALLLKRQQKRDEELISLRKHQDLEATILERDQSFLILLLLGVFCALMMALIFIVSIRLTHRVAGPLFKIGRYVDQIKAHKLQAVDPLRKGDLLTDFHQRFSQMAEAIQARTEIDIEVLEGLLELCKKENLDDPVIERMEQLLTEKKEALGQDA